MTTWSLVPLSFRGSRTLAAGLVMLAGAAAAQDCPTLGCDPLRPSLGGELDEPAWRGPFLQEGTDVTTAGGMDTYRQPGGELGTGVESGGLYVYRDPVRGSVLCTDTAGLISCR